jgi:hypothetical protein
VAGRWFDNYTHLHFLDDGNELIESLSPTLVESHLLVFLAGLFISVDYEGSVLRPISVRLKRNDRREGNVSQGITAGGMDGR